MISIIIYDQQKWASNTLSRLNNWFFFPSIFSMRLPQPHLIWCTPWGMKTTWSAVISLHHPLVFFFPPSLSIWKKGEPLWCNVSLCVYIRVFLPKRFSCGEGKRAHLQHQQHNPLERLSGYLAWDIMCGTTFTIVCWRVLQKSAPTVKISFVLSVWRFPEGRVNECLAALQKQSWSLCHWPVM